MGETEQVFKELEGETVSYKATAYCVKSATVVRQISEGGDVVLKVKVDDPGDRLHGFSDEEVAAGEAERYSTHGLAPGQWTMDVQTEEADPNSEPIV